MKKGGWTEGDMRRAMRIASLSEEEFEAALRAKKHVEATIKSGDRAFDREVRRIIRAREAR